MYVYRGMYLCSGLVFLVVPLKWTCLLLMALGGRVARYVLWPMILL